MSTFHALRVTESGPKLVQMTEDQLTAGEVTVAVQYSGINYKDALAVTGKGKILKQLPLNPGIDAAGTVTHSTIAAYKPGQKVLVTGCGIGENDDGGYSEVLRAQAASVVALPDGLTLKEAMMLGTAGFTAALALSRMLTNGQKKEMGPILVTGASGGVGGFAVQIFSQAGFEVHALSGKKDAVDYLKKFGAAKVIAPEDLQLGKRPLESVMFGGAVDNVGGELLSKVLAHTQLWGNVAAIGLADSHVLNTTVMPFILRGVSLLGTSSNNTTRDLRLEIWKNLAGAWKPKHLADTHARTVTLKDLPAACEDLLNRKVRGRILVETKA